MRKMLVFILILSAISCRKNEKLPPIDEGVDLDGKLINDSSLLDPSAFLVSAYAQTHNDIKLDDPVYIAAHGFSASTREWMEFASYARSKGARVSRVLLGGHGRDYRDFRDASWEDWQKPIITEYNALRALGFTNIHFVASSTGCPLVLDMLHNKKIELPDSRVTVIFVDPIIIPSNKQLSLAPLVGGTVVKYTTTDLAEGEKGFWYRYRPQEALRELNILTKKVRKDLEKGISLPDNVKLTIYKCDKDESADPVSAPLLEKGLNHCVVNMVSSDKHVFTRLAGRNNVTNDDIRLQQETFKDILP